MALLDYYIVLSLDNNNLTNKPAHFSWITLSVNFPIKYLCIILVAIATAKSDHDSGVFRDMVAHNSSIDPQTSRNSRGVKERHVEGRVELFSCFLLMEGFK